MNEGIREKILKILSSPSSVTEIKSKLPEVKSFGTIAYHLKNLKNEGVVTSVKDNKKQGQTTIYKLNSPEIIKRISAWNKTKKEMELIILKKIKENPLIEDGELSNILEQEGLDWEFGEDIILECAGKHLSVLCHKITPKGEKFLKKQSK